ncbi:MAG: hypothetical protein ACE5I5_16650, partial [Candidatus Heimdallarchaeota archaeon]
MRKKIVGLLFAMAFVAMMLSVPRVSARIVSEDTAGIVSEEWTYNKDIKGLTTLDFTSSFVVTGDTNPITIQIYNHEGSNSITVKRVEINKVTPRSRGREPGYTANLLPPPIDPVTIDADKTRSLNIICTSEPGANVHLWVYFTITNSGQTGTYHIGVNLHFRRAFGAMMSSVPGVGDSAGDGSVDPAGDGSVEWTYGKDIKGLTTLDFTSSFVVTGERADISITIINKGSNDITVTRVEINKVTPRSRGGVPKYDASLLPPPIDPVTIGADKTGSTGSLNIICTSEPGANVHLWV